MAGKGARVHIYGDWDGTGVKKAQQDVSTFGKTTSGFSKGITGDFAKIGLAAGAAFGGFALVGKATDFLRDAAAAALEDQKSMVGLAKAMDNVGASHQVAQVEAYVSGLMTANGVADDVLRPSLQRLITATGDVAKSQELMSLAMDISAGTGKSLEQVTTALSRAASGNTAALGRLGAGIDKTTLASGDLDKITGELSDKFKGQAATAANTYQGKLNRLSVAAGEAQEAIGYALLGAIDELSQSFGGTDGATQAVTDFGEGIANTITGASMLIKPITDVIGKVTTLNGLLGEGGNLFNSWLVTLGPIGMGIDALSKIGQSQGDGSSRGQDAETSRLQAQANAYNKLNGKVADQQAKAEAATAKARTDALKNRLGGGASAAKAQIETMRLMWSTLSTDANTGLDALDLIIQGKSQTISGKMVDTFKTRFDGFKEIVSAQSQVITDARKSLDDYASSVTDTIMGKIDFGQTDAEGKPLTPEQIVKLLLGDIANQAATVTALANSGVMTNLPAGLSQKILAMDPAGAVALANYLAANPALITQLTTNYDALALTTETLLGVPMATAYAKVGDQSAVAMIAAAKLAIKQNAANFTKWVSNQLDSKVYIDVVYRAVNSPSGAQMSVPAMANGGIVNGPTLALIGEAGPEAVVPLDRMNRMGGGGSIFNITVNAGVGDKSEIGRTVVGAISAYEKRSGKVYARP